MGDGISQCFEAEGLLALEAGTGWLLFHEFGHHIQLASGTYDDSDGSPEFTRYTELMADTLAAYYEYHPRGATFRQQRIEQAARTAFNIGDCVFDDPAHHGTPKQREKAVRIAVQLVEESLAKGHILGTADVISAFDEVYDELIAPDAN